ncbi:arsenate reductase (glutaredoxin) [Aestuariibacter sp. AA17]|uniref:Arsenate reductase n=1 Tax=Fluctibacter corallii TaxID=2984329 RepID=A0ABT3A5V3_9ALTE|nr:arsenate reductase (glutaredoxin) [Aestuariibacter sp. AA17]MCV2884044.1 arsenate reductase (glutaredoxin) [Aestuariibacter sp. AA17]
MSEIKILHNPRCSKSRQTLQLLEEKGVSPVIVEYLKTPLGVEEITSIMKKLGISDPREMMRTKEDEYKAQNLKDNALLPQQLVEAMANTPKLIERPIVIHGDKAKIGRPPESVLDIL